MRVKVSGRLQLIAVDLGTAIKAGQTAAQIEPDDYRLCLYQAEAALSQTRTRLGLSARGSDDQVNPEQTATVRQGGAVPEQARLAAPATRLCSTKASFLLAIRPDGRSIQGRCTQGFTKLLPGCACGNQQPN